MITVGFSTRKINPSFVDYIRATIGPKNVEIIPIENDGKYSLTEAYNMILDQAQNDIVILMHDDIYFENKSWGSNVLFHFQKNPEYGILGVAGTTHMPKSGQWWEDRTKMHGIVNHEHEGKKWESKYSNSLGKGIQDVVVCDGLFLCVNKNKIKKTFNEEVKGFHMYDIDFCFRNFLEDVKVGVIYDVRVTHKSIGMTNQEWENNKNKFAETYKDFLPAKIIKTQNSKINFLVLMEDLNEDLIELVKNYDYHLISEIKNKKYKNYQIFSYHNLPGIKIGDGKFQIKTNQGETTSIKDRFYKTSNLSYDLIISDSQKLSEQYKYIHNTTPHLTLTNNNSKHITINKVSDLNMDLILKVLNDDVKKEKIKIVTGYSERGGSTTALSNLANLFNENGYSCTMYGPHDYHLKLCQSDLLSNLKFEESDHIISHFINLGNRPNVKKIVLSSHEKWWFKPSSVPQHWDEVIFLHEEHKKYHSDYIGPYGIIPNVKENLTKIDKSYLDLVAGVIGGIEERKQTHISVRRALDDGCEKVLIYGKINDKDYYQKNIEPILSEKVILMNFMDDKQKIYNSIGRVYHSSNGEVACLIKDECYLTGTKFFGNHETENEVSKLTNKEILQEWKKILKIDEKN